MSPEQPPSHPRRLTLLTGGDPDQESGPSGERVQVAPDVAHALGAATVLRLRADPTSTEFTCQFCYTPGSLDDTGATVIAFRWADDLTVVRFAHPDCSPSSVLNVLRRPPPPRIRVRAACWLAPEPVAHAWTSRAVLLIIHDVRAWPRAQAGDADEQYADALHTIGFTALTHLDQTPPTLASLTITISGHDTTEPGTDPREGRVEQTAVVAQHLDSVLFEGDLDVPGPWRHAARTTGRVVLLTGDRDRLAGLSHGRLPAPATGPVRAAVAALKDDFPTARDTPRGRRT